MLEGIDWGIVFWLLAGGLTGIGEVLTGTLFLLPFAVGAFAAAGASALGADIPLVLVVFCLFSLATFLWAVRYGRRIRSEPPATREGANRYVGAAGVVIAAIEGRSSGQVRVGTETWRALSADAGDIDTGTAVHVVEVRGNALVVDADGEDPDQAT